MEGSFGDVKVSNPVLKEKAEDAYRKIKIYKEALDRMKKSLENSDAFWIGKGGEAFRGRFDTEYEKAKTAIEEYEEYPKELLRYVGIYSEVMQETNSKAESLESYHMY